MSTGDGFGYCWGRNGEFCLAVGPVIWTASTPDYCMLVQLGITFAYSKVKGGKLPFDGSYGVCINLLYCVAWHNIISIVLAALVISLVYVDFISVFI